MQRRRFVQAVTAATAVAEALPAQSPVDRPKLTTTTAELVAEPTTHFFTPTQFATLKHLSAILQPPANGRPGALETGAAEFLDFLLSVSPPPRQHLYQSGLDHLDTESRRQFNKPFPALTTEQAGTILRPLLTVWDLEPPTDPLQRFLADVRADVRTATQNSKEMATITSRSRRGPGGPSQYWLPIDPTR